VIPIIIISGPTATGKTDLAATIAKKYHVELISADSRQIYQGLDIGVGKDHPKDTPIHLIDLIPPDKIFSVSDFQKLALQKINEIHRRGHLPIIVGCSGFYIDSIINPQYSTFSIKPRRFLRFVLNLFPKKLLQLSLKLIDRQTFARLNHSDLNNPRRLIRKIELSLSNIKKHSPPLSSKRGVGGDFSILHLSLTSPNSYLYRRIDIRVKKRLKLGILNEISQTLKTYSWSDPGLKISAYYRLKPYFDQQKSLENCLISWQHAEHRDARHQKTWLKKYSSATPIDISLPGYRQKALSLVARWYNQL